MNRGFWDKLPKPIIAMSPMDGVTDAAFRYVVDKYGRPSILFTEFTSVEGIAAGAEKLLNAFIYHKTSTPIVGQVFGSTPNDFYKAAFVLSEMGFDGIDINMGCPDPHVAKKGGGAALILNPSLAKEIITTTKRATEDWANGTDIAKIGLNEKIIDWVKRFVDRGGISVKKVPIPVSVKTRIGYEQIVTESWIENLLETEPVNISLHGRTLKQMYTGSANWEEIAKAAKIVKKTSTTLLGNGDIKSKADAIKKISDYGLDGVLIGRATFGAPEIFTGESFSLNKKLNIAIEHCEAFENLTPELNFLSVRKHLAWYCKGFENAVEARIALMQTNSADEVREVIKKILNVRTEPV